MSLYEKIQQDMLNARKTKDSVTLTVLSTLVGEIQRGVGVPNIKEPYSDNVIIALVRKNVKGCNDAIVEVTSKITESNAETVGSYIKSRRDEIGVLEKYIPVQLSEEEIKQVIAGSGVTSLKDGMAHLAANYTGRYDGKVASGLLKSMFK